MESREIEAFLALADEHHFGRAAKRLGAADFLSVAARTRVPLGHGNFPVG